MANYHVYIFSMFTNAMHFLVKLWYFRTQDIQQTHFLFNGDGSMKPTLLGPPPQIKILKRPQHNGNSHQAGKHNHENGQGKPKLQVKTLQQVQIVKKKIPNILIN
jgi:hypothetical protein